MRPWALFVASKPGALPRLLRKLFTVWSVSGSVGLGPVIVKWRHLGSDSCAFLRNFSFNFFSLFVTSPLLLAGVNSDFSAEMASLRLVWRTWVADSNWRQETLNLLRTKWHTGNKFYKFKNKRIETVKSLKTTQDTQDTEEKNTETPPLVLQVFSPWLRSFKESEALGGAPELWLTLGERELQEQSAIFVAEGAIFRDSDISYGPKVPGSFSCFSILW